ncbi:MAG: ABC transporter transmembrane domain-containing protein [Phycisphaerales bacterium]
MLVLRIIVDLRARVYDKMQRLSFGFFDANQSGSIINRVTSDVQAVRMFIDGVLIEVLMLLISLVFFIGYIQAIHGLGWASSGAGDDAGVVDADGDVLASGEAGVPAEPGTVRHGGTSAVGERAGCARGQGFFASAAGDREIHRGERGRA